MKNDGVLGSRKFPRVTVNLPVLVVGRGGQTIARLINISLGGCQLESEMQARVGEILSVSYGQRAPVHGFQAKVVWATPSDNAFNFGGSFWGTDEDSKRDLMEALSSIAPIAR